ncbi:hypothetical protein [Kibdelosporangium phytohabitans]|uniref:hypothetical protein n=1 Tax=Kibdelosporangium phytohabitans TaxID=860235 RepID=UPI0012F79481|nr:hypothetical protein [Kibdelosporangium phytohabitans]MBE1464042.1 hypothetical protein [Kibdelosporangium phytohabitans]
MAAEDVLYVCLFIAVVFRAATVLDEIGEKLMNKVFGCFLTLLLLAVVAGVL